MMPAEHEPRVAPYADRGGGRAIRNWAGAVGVVSMFLGAWGFFLPESFYEDFPYPGAGWVSTLGPLNEHLMTDYGAAQVGLGLAALLVALTRNRGGIAAVMAGFVAHGTLHLGFHLGTFARFDAASAAAQGVSLTVFILIPLAVLWAARDRTRKDDT